MCEQRCGHCHACCQFQREWCLSSRQLVSLREKTCSRERDQTFTTEYLWSGSTQISRHIFCGFQWGLELGDPHTLTDSQTSIHECSQIHSEIHTCTRCLQGGKEKEEIKIEEISHRDHSNEKWKREDLRNRPTHTHTHTHTHQDPMLENAVVELWSTVVMRLHLKPMKPLWQLMKARLVSPPSPAAGWCGCVIVSKMGRGKNGQYLARSALLFSKIFPQTSHSRLKFSKHTWISHRKPTIINMILSCHFLLL